MTTTALALSARLADLLRNERASLADFLVALADFDRKRLWRELDYTSLFWFLHRELGLSKGAAFYRKTAAELLQRVPSLRGPLADGRICLTTVPELAKVLTPENEAEVLPRFFQVSRREAAEVTAALAPTPAPPLREVVTTVRAPAQPSASELSTAAPCAEELVTRRSGSPVNPPRANRIAPGEVPAPPVRRDRPVLEVEPLTADLRRLHLTVPKRLLEKLDAARDALSHSHPDADAAAVIEAALDLVLERAAKRRGLVKRPRTTLQEGQGAAPSSRSRYISAAVRRAVWRRDAGRCQYPLASGGVCGSTRRVQIDHVDGWAKGGAATADKLRLCCEGHNLHAARKMYGDEVMDRYAGKLSEPVADYGTRAPVRPPALVTEQRACAFRRARRAWGAAARA